MHDFFVLARHVYGRLMGRAATWACPHLSTAFPSTSNDIRLAIERFLEGRRISLVDTKIKFWNRAQNRVPLVDLPKSIELSKLSCSDIGNAARDLVANSRFSIFSLPYEACKRALAGSKVDVSTAIPSWIERIPHGRNGCQSKDPFLIDGRMPSQMLLLLAFSSKTCQMQ